MKFTKSSAISFGKSKKIEKTNENPGAGLYNPKDKCIKKKVPEYNFSKTKKFNDKPSEIPGPGEYDINVIPTRSPQYSIPKKPREISISDKLNYSLCNPSSSALFLKSPKEKQQNLITSTGKSNETGEIKSRFGENIGEKNDKFGVSSKYGSNRKKLNINDDIVVSVPGPGAYSTKDKFIKSKTQTFSFAKDKRMKPNEITPGPGEYINETSAKNYSHGYTVGKTKREIRISHHEVTPGPGLYNIIPKTANAPKYTIGKKLDNKNKFISPGPGEYIIEPKDMKTKAPHVKIGKSSRDNLIVDKNKTLTPGPGLYNTNKPKEKEKGFKFGKDKRMKDSKEVTPGPGQYLIPCSVADVSDYNTSGTVFDKDTFKYV